MISVNALHNFIYVICKNLLVILYTLSLYSLNFRDKGGVVEYDEMNVDATTSHFIADSASPAEHVDSNPGKR